MKNCIKVIGLIIGIIFLFSLTELSAQIGCITSAGGVAAEYDDQLPAGTSVYSFNIMDETPIGAADPVFFQTEWPALPVLGYQDFVNPLGSTQSDSIFCVTTVDASNEGPDILLDIVIPIEARMTCAEINFTICRVGDYNGFSEVVWIVNKELMDVDPTNPSHVLACIPGTGGTECQGYSEIDCAQVTIPASQVTSYFGDGLMSIALISPGGLPGSGNNSGSHADANCADPLETGNCFRMTDFSFDIVDAPIITSFAASDLCVGATITATSTATGTLPITYTWSVLSGNVSLGLNGSQDIDVTANGPGSYELQLEIVNGSGECIDIQSAVHTVYSEPLITDPSDVGPICANENASFSVSVSGGTPPYDFSWESSTDGINFLPMSDVDNYNGTTSNTLNITSVTNAQNGLFFRATVDDANSCGGTTGISMPAMLTVSPCVPIIDLTKELVSVNPASSGILGNVNATYRFVLCNTGPIDVQDIDLVDNLGAQFGDGFIGISFNPTIQNTTAGSPPSLNTTYSGLSPNDNIFNTDGILALGTPGECITVLVGYELDLSELPFGAENQAVADAVSTVGLMATDQSDNHSPTDPDDPNSDDDDPTPFPEIAYIIAKKSFLGVVPTVGGLATTSFQLEVENIGNTHLSSLSLLDDLTGLGLAYIPGTSMVSSLASTANSSPLNNDGIFDGTANTLSGGDGDLITGTAFDDLAPGQIYQVELQMDINPMIFTSLNLSEQINQATALGVPTDPAGNQIVAEDITGAIIPIGGTVSDLSDDPFDLPNIDEDDPTPFELPGLLDLTKSVISPLTYPATSNIIGNAEADYSFRLCNVGGDAVINLSLIDDFSMQFGTGYVGLVSGPSIVASTAATNPSLNSNYDGTLGNENMFVGNNGALQPDQCITVNLTIEVDLDLLPVPTFNQATTSGLDQLFGLNVTDQSDNDILTDPDDPNSDDDDPTPFPLYDLVASAKYVNNIDESSTPNWFDVNFQIIIENNSNTILTDVSVFDDFSAVCGFQNIDLTSLTILPGSPSMAILPTINAAFDGSDGITSIINGTGINMNPGEQFIINLTALINPDLCPQPYANQVQVDANTISGGTATDLSDSGPDPESYNLGESGDTGGQDDPTPYSIPGLRISKTISNSSAAASGVVGNLDLVYELSVHNSGFTNLTNLQVTDQLNAATNLGSAFVAIINAPALTATTATNDPSFNANYDGTLGNLNIFDGISGQLQTGENFTFTLSVEVDPNVIGAPSPMLNQATASAIDPSGFNVDDLSDSGTDPLTNNIGDPGDTGGSNDPVPFIIETIGLAKEVDSFAEAASGIQGNFDVIYLYNIENTGNVILNNLSLTDVFNEASNLGAAYQGMVSNPIILNSTATSDPSLNINYDGGALNSNMFNGTSGVLEPGQTLSLSLTVEVDPDAINAPTLLFNQAVVSGFDPLSNQISDDSDSGSDPESNNIGDPGDTGGSDDPTPLSLASIGAAKSIVSVNNAQSGIVGNSDITYRVAIRNNGNITLNNINLRDDLSLGTNLGTAFVGLVNTPALMTSTATTDPVLNPNYNGTNINALIFDGISGVLSPEEELVIEFMVEVNPNSIGANSPLFNQAVAEGTDPDGVQVNDDSDSGTNPVGINLGEPGDTGGSDDPVPLVISDIGLSKEVAGLVPAMSGVEGNFDVTFQFSIINVGNQNLINLNLIDALNSGSNLGTSFVGLTSSPAIISSTATTDPMLNIGYDGTASNENIFDGSSGQLAQGETIDISMVVEVNPDAPGALSIIYNQAIVDGLDPNLMVVSDLSDSGTDPESNNLGGPGDTGGEDDPTPVLISALGLSKTVLNSVPSESSTVGNFDVTFELTLQNTGNTILNTINLLDDLMAVTNLASTFVGIVSMPAITLSTVNTDPVLNTNFDGTALNPNLFDGLSGVIDTRQFITLRFTAEVDPNALLAPSPLLNQATADGLDPGGANIIDESDSGLDPTSNNIGDDGDTGGFDDPTPIPLSEIGLAKSLIAASASASGIQGNFDLTYELNIENLGNQDLINLSLIDDLTLMTQLGSSFIGVVGLPALGSSTASTDPTLNGSYDGTAANPNMFDGLTGVLASGQTLSLTLIVEVDPDAAGAPNILLNQATVSGENPDGDIISDDSDSGTDPESTNIGDPDDTGGEDDPTSSKLANLGLAKTILNVVPATSGVIGNFNATVSIVIRNNGTENLSDINIVDELSNNENFGTAYVGLISAPNISSTTASSNPNVNSNYDGITDNDLFDGVSGLLSPGQIITIEFTVELNPNANAAPIPLYNQAEGFANDPESNQISDLSDSGIDPVGLNIGEPGDTGGSDDPVLLEISEIGLAKSVIQSQSATSGNLGNFDVAFQLVIANIGNTQLSNIAIQDDLTNVNNLGSAYVGLVTAPNIVASTATLDPNLNANFDGTSINEDIFDGLSGTLNSGQTMIVEYVIEVDPDAPGAPNFLFNQANVTAVDLLSNSVLDLSDSGPDPESINLGEPNDTGGEDDPTPINVSHIGLAKTISSVQSAASNIVGNYDVIYAMRIQNAGTETLTLINLLDELNSSTNLGLSFIQVVNPPIITNSTATIDPVLNSSYDGTSLNDNIFDGLSGSLEASQFIDITIQVEVDPNALGASTILLNQSMVSATDPLLNIIADLSDSGVDPLGSNIGEPGDTGGSDDPVPLEIATLGLAKTASSFVSSASGIQGNFDVTYQFVIVNRGNVELNNLALVDQLDLASQLGSAFIGLVSSPNIVFSSASTDPTLNNLYDGTALNSNMFDGLSGLLLSGESITIDLTIEIDPDAIGAPTELINQATVSGQDPDGDTFMDDSDSGTDPESNNDGDPDDTGGEDDPTSVALQSIGLAKTIVSSGESVSGVFANYDLVYSIVFTNNGNATMNNLNLIDQLDAMTNLSSSFVNVVVAPNIVASSASIDPTLNNLYDGLVSNPNIFNGSTGTLLPGESITLELTVEVNPNAFGTIFPMQNQASGEAQDPEGIVASDDSDSGTNTSGTNPGEPGDTGGSDDPVPFEVSRIGVAKSLISVSPTITANPGNFDALYQVHVRNNGNQTLSNLRLVDNLIAIDQLGTAFISVVQSPSISASTAAADPVLNSLFNGNTQTDILDGLSGILLPGQEFTLEFTLEIDPDAIAAPIELFNQITGFGTDPLNNVVQDLSDSGLDPEGNNIGGPGDTGGDDDPTPFNITEIGIAKSITSIVPSSNGTFGNFDVSYILNLQNLGSSTLSNLQINDLIESSQNIGSAFIGLIQAPAIISSSANIDPVFNPTFNGRIGNENLFSGSNGELSAAQIIEISYTIEVDPNALGSPIDMMNQAVAFGSDPLGEQVTDLSDSGLQADGINAGAPGDTGGEDDPTPLVIAELALVKSLVSYESPLSGNVGELDIIMHLSMQNIGNVPLANINLNDQLDASNHFGAYFLGLASGTFPEIVNSSASIDPNLNVIYTGDLSNSNIFDGVSGLLDTNEEITIELRISLDVADPTIPNLLFNSGLVSGQASDLAGVLLMDEFGNLIEAMDLSDSGTMYESNNSGAPGDTGGEDDPTPVPLLGELLSFVWDDSNGDGIQDPEEFGIPGIEVNLYNCNDVFIANTLTDGMGNYTFEFLIPGDYYILITNDNIPDDYQISPQYQGDPSTDSNIDETGRSECFNIAASQVLENIDAGFAPLPSIGDFVWIDLNGDGMQSQGEEGLEAIKVNLFTDEGILVSTDFTDSSGGYLFEGMNPGYYYIQYEIPEGYDFTLPNSSGNEGSDSDVDNSNGPGTTPIFYLQAGQDLLTVDAGFYECIEIGDLVWYDSNENDRWENIENGVNGLRVNLYKRYPDGEYILYDYTHTGQKPNTPSDDGYFKFCAPPGNYYLEFVDPPYGLVPALPNRGSDEEIDSDITNANGPGTTASFNVESGDQVLDFGAGYYPMGTIGDLVFMDDNQNGMRDPGEAGLPNVYIEAVNYQGDLVGQTMSDEDGQYTIEYLQKMDVFLRFLPPNNLIATKPNEGSDLIDSDIDGSNGPMTTSYYDIQSGEHQANVDAGFINGSLPVEWLSIEGETENNFNWIEWKLAYEKNVSHYEIERTLVEFSSFEQIAKVLSKGDNYDGSSYQFQDYDIQNLGTSYYRIKQIDFDGNFSYSDVIALTRIDKSGERLLKTYPNPTTDNFNLEIEITEANSSLSYQVYDRNGALVKNPMLLSNNLTKGVKTFNISVKSLVPGIYTFRFINGNLIQDRRIVVLIN